MTSLYPEEPVHRDAPSKLLGIGRGVDHVMIVVRNLNEAKEDYNRLGFAITPGVRGPTATENAAIRLANNGYLELLGLYNPAAPAARELSEFLSKQEGGFGVGLDVSSAGDTSKHLRGAGYEIDGPTEGWSAHTTENVPPSSLWPMVPYKFVNIKTPKPILGDAIFFIEYDEAVRASLRSKYPHLATLEAGEGHPNTAVRIGSIWLATRDLAKAADDFRTIGLAKSRRIEVSAMGAVANEIEVGSGTFLVLQSEDSGGPVEQFLDQRKSNDGVLGVSIEVESLDAAVGVLRARVPTELQPYDGVYGKSILVPPVHTHGLWIEMFQREG